MTKADKLFTECPYAREERLVRRDRLRLGLAFGGAVLLHASTALGLVYWEPPEPAAPPGEMVIVFDLEVAAASDAQADHTGKTEPLAAQAPQPTPPEEDVKEEEVVEEIEPTPEPLVEEDVAQVPKAEEAEVIIAPKEKKKKEKKKPKPVAPSQAATSAAKPKADVAGKGASASPSEINAYLARVRAAIERSKKTPVGGGKGVAYVAATITRSGGISGLRVARSSGIPALDSAARATVASASIPPIPEGLPASMSFGVPINFR